MHFLCLALSLEGLKDDIPASETLHSLFFGEWSILNGQTLHIKTIGKYYEELNPQPGGCQALGNTNIFSLSFFCAYRE